MKIAKAFVGPNYDLYRQVNDLRSDEKWLEIIDLARGELEYNKDLFVLGRLMESLCIYYGMEGFKEAMELFKDIDMYMDSMPEKEIERIYTWINTSFWYSVFKNEHLIQEANKVPILKEMLLFIPDELNIMRQMIQSYIMNHMAEDTCE